MIFWLKGLVNLLQTAFIEYLTLRHGIELRNYIQFAFLFYSYLNRGYHKSQGGSTLNWTNVNHNFEGFPAKWY